MKPITKWAQDDKQIFIRLDILPDDNDIITLENSHFTFKNNKYELQLELLHDVKSDLSIKKTRYYQITIDKVNTDMEYWNALIKNFTSNDKNWLKIDWDKWIDEPISTIKFTCNDNQSSESDMLSLHSSSESNNDS